MFILKKILISLFIMIVGIISIKADIPTGSWIVHSSFVLPTQKIIENDDALYFLTGGSLFCQYKKNEESIGLVYYNPLNDWNIKDIVYSDERKKLIVIYDNSNIDIIDNSGNIINVPDIKYSSGIDDKTIYGVVFDGINAYIATGFGLVVININTGHIKDSIKYNVPVEAIAINGDKIFIITEGNLYYANKSEIKKLADYQEVGSIRDVDELYAISQDQLMLRTGGLISIGIIEDKIFKEYEWLEILDKPLIYGEEGIYCITKDNRLWRMDYSSAYRHILCDIPEILNDEIIGGLALENEYWSITKEGILKKKYINGNWISESERYIPQRTLTARNIDYIIPGSFKDNIYFGNIGATLWRNNYDVSLDVIQELSLLKDDKFIDKSVVNVEGEFYNVVIKQNIHGPYLFTPQRFCEDPDDNDIYFIGTGNDGLYKIKGREYIGRYGAGNSPISNPWGYRVFEASIDKGGNLWIGYDGTGIETGVAVLPSDKRILEPNQVDVSDWVLIDTKGMPVDRDMRIFHCNKYPVTIIFNWNGNDGLIFYDNNNTPDFFSDDKIYYVNRLIDQDGLIFSPERFTAIVEDNQGRIWIGCEGGVIEIENPGMVSDSQLNVRRLKIGHDDGTGLADYFCETDLVFDISVDGANRKWVATGESGVYLLNSEGNVIIDNFTTSNSPLPSNEVKAVYANPTNNSVYFGTEYGLLEYGNNASFPKEDFSSIKVYPNPVTPQTPVNFVTISGLVDGTVIKITDSMGNLVWEGQAEGGMVQWVLENNAGRRMSTGVYYVFLSSQNSGNAIAKIMIVN